MTNFIFKSQGTYKKLCHQLLIIQNELRHQRSDNAMILSLLNKLLINHHLQTQVDDFYKQDETVHPDDVQDLD